MHVQVPADMARHRSAGGDSSRLEGGSSWLKMIPGIFQKNARSVESLPRLGSEVLSDNVYECADDTTGLPKGFSSTSAYNGLEAQQFSIDMARLPNSEPLPSASTRGPQRLAESCQIRNDRLQLKNKRPPLSASVRLTYACWLRTRLLCRFCSSVAAVAVFLYIGCVFVAAFCMQWLNGVFSLP